MAQKAPAATAADTTKIGHVTYAQGSDITAQLQQVFASAGGGNGQDSPFTITLPPGMFYCTSNVVWPSNKRLKLVGAGKYVTRLCFVNDTGPGTYAINTTYNDPFPIEISDMSIIGPNHSSSTGNNLGFAPAQMSGIHAPSESDLENVDVGGFYAGIAIDGNHHIVNHCTAGDNYYGLYWMPSTDGTSQDDYVGLCDLCGNRFAGVGVAYDAMCASMFVRDHVGFEPYAFYKEAAKSGSGQLQPFLSGCSLHVCNLEGVGNADYFDATGQAGINNCSFYDCGGFGSFYGFAIPAANAAGGVAPAVGPAMTVGGFFGNNVYGAGPSPGGITAGFLYNNVWRLPGLLAELTSGNMAPPKGCTSGNVYNDVIEDGAQKATLAMASAAVSKNQPLELSSGYYGSVFTVKPAAGAAPVAGVALTDASVGTVAIVGTHGVFGVAGQWLPLNSTIDVMSDGSLAATGGAQIGFGADSSSNNNGLCNVFVNSQLL